MREPKRYVHVANLSLQGFVYGWLFLLFTFTFTIALVNILTALFVAPWPCLS